MSESTPNRPWMKDRRVGIAILIGFAAVVVVVVVIVLATGGNSNHKGAQGTTHTRPTTPGNTTFTLPKVTTPQGAIRKGVTVAKLHALARKVHHPVFWVGTMKNAVYEVTYSKRGDFVVRYLPSGSKVGSRNFIVSVTTSPFLNAYQAVGQLTREGGMKRVSTKGGAAAVTSQALPQSIRVAFPDKANRNYQIEVVSPSVARVKQLVESGAVRPVS